MLFQFFAIPSITATDEKESEGSKKDKKVPAVKFPLNQLTWPELARMIVLSQVLKDQGRGREDIQQALRGSRQPNYRAAKNVVRLIRLRLAAKIKSLEGSDTHTGFNSYTDIGAGTCVVSSRCKSQHGEGPGVGDDDRLYSQFRTSTNTAATTTATTSTSTSSSHSLTTADSVRTRGEAILLVGDAQESESESVVYSSESEVIAALMHASVDQSYSEAYQRCCKVLIRIANLSQSKHFFWEIDSVMFPDYYSSIRRPMMIANVTARLMSRSYGTESNSVCDQFYTDMRQVVLNCLAFNTEVTAVNAQAQKIHQVSQSICRCHFRRQCRCQLVPTLDVVIAARIPIDSIPVPYNMTSYHMT